MPWSSLVVVALRRPALGAGRSLLFSSLVVAVLAGAMGRISAKGDINLLSSAVNFMEKVIHLGTESFHVTLL